MRHAERSVAGRSHGHTLWPTFFLLALLVAPLVACASKPDNSATPNLEIGSLDEAAYAKLVQPVVESRCGTLDCHGQLPRGLRVYGRDGLRLPYEDGGVPGVLPTTAAEALATYQSIVGLEPEQTNALLAKPSPTQADAYKLTFVRKGTATERHRGGVALHTGEPAEQCIVTWLTGNVDAPLCAKAVSAPAP